MTPRSFKTHRDWLPERPITPSYKVSPTWRLVRLVELFLYSTCWLAALGIGARVVGGHDYAGFMFYSILICVCAAAVHVVVESWYEDTHPED